jgi:hypothetical protein
MATLPAVALALFTLSFAAQQQQNCISSAPQVVDDIYQQVLERSADPASAELTQALAAGRMTVRDVVARVAKSPEYAERFFWQPVVSALYTQVMRRDPSQQELRDTTADLAAGHRRLPDVIARVARRAARDDEEAVRLLYRRLLGRDADPDGLRTYTEMARRDGIEAVGRDIVASAEYQQRTRGAEVPRDDAAAYERAVRSLYRHVLARDPDPEGLRDLTRVAANDGLDAVVDRLVNSREYQRSYGDNVVPGRGVRYCGTTRSPQP